MANFKTKPCHWEIILDFFTANPTLATGKFSGVTGREKQRKLWEELVFHLNSAGLGEKSVDKWQKVCLLKTKILKDIYKEYLIVLVMDRLQVDFKEEGR